MAYGQADVAGVFALPDSPELGPETWAEMSGMFPGHPLVGGRAGSPGYEGGPRQVAVGQQAATLPPATGAPSAAHWSQLFNMRGNPIGWVLIAALAYWALNYVHFQAGAGARASVRGGR